MHGNVKPLAGPGSGSGSHLKKKVAAAAANVTIASSSVSSGHHSPSVSPRIGEPKDPPCTLVECLERNFAVEKLTHYSCSNPECNKQDTLNNGFARMADIIPDSSLGATQESMKHVTVKHLPPVLSIQLKVRQYPVVLYSK